MQGEGVRAGTLNHFVRFTGCNLRCSVDNPEPNAQFDCDTEWVSGRKMTAAEIIAFMQDLNPKCKNIIFTGGEPGLQLDKELVDALHADGYYLAIETNGTIDVTGLGLDWITVSPKVAEHVMRCPKSSELKYVRHHGQGIPKPSTQADHYLISPAFDGTFELDQKVLKWCIGLIKENPEWRLSVQQHKQWRVR